jgi:hypothetical protein
MGKLIRSHYKEKTDPAFKKAKEEIEKEAQFEDILPLPSRKSI